MQANLCSPHCGTCLHSLRWLGAGCAGYRLAAVSSKGWGIPHDRSYASILLTYLFVTS